MNDGTLFDTPILLLAFDRPESTYEVFKSIRCIRPSRLYVSCDGPRHNAAPSQLDRIEQVKQIMTKVDWDCQVHTLFQETNQGCRLAVSTAVDWFFKHEEQGIILEDDCVPSPSFYPYCAQLLDRYASDSTVGMISGNNVTTSHAQQLDQPCNSIVCSFGNIWGWATWRNRWHYFTDDKDYWADPERISKIRSFINNDKLFYVYNTLRKKYIRGSIDSWAVPWLFSRLEAHMLTINPVVNLVRNIGFNTNASHTDNTNDQSYCIESTDLVFPLKLPTNLKIDESYIQAASNLPFFANIKYHLMSSVLPGRCFQ